MDCCNISITTICIKICMKKLILSILKEEEGYATVELLITMSIVGITAFTIYGKLMPVFRNLYGTSQQNIIKPCQSGY